METAKSEHDGTMWSAEFMLRQLTELAVAMRPKGRSIHIQRTRSSRGPGDVDFIEIERQLLLELITRRKSGETFAALAADLNKREVRGRYGARWYTASVRAFLRRKSVDHPVS